MKKNRDPRWDEEFQFMLEEPPTNERIHVEVVSVSSRMGLLHPKVLIFLINFHPYHSCIDIDLFGGKNNSCYRTSSESHLRLLRSFCSKVTTLEFFLQLGHSFRNSL